MSHAVLLAAVLADPDADAPRLAYADAIDAIDPERARFIRAQIAATHKRRAGESWGAELQLTQALLAQRRADWSPGLPVTVTEVGFYRGFPELVSLSLDAFVTTGEAIASAMPLCHADLHGAHGQLDRLAGPSVDRLVSLGLARNGLDDADAAALATLRPARLRWLDLGFNKLGSTGIEALAAAPGFVLLDFVDLMGNPGGQPVDVPVHAEVGLDDAWPTAFGRELEARHGPIAWLHAPARHRQHWPPDRGDY